ncbi:Imidazolonepropionase [Sporobacter termitidis DSM 10068]|uniref:Imidazolonepropionase n=1 Tax=Sporobacter termitidis DSM 10068 TaxID=1123282 RepID=A0A1M5XWI5_9FIRM|nr:amidohydrolase family protein [Sporobacter termitidis]SHI03603.1 Imidazolonepropionase [Sporobacter termitidis DSM 10068]
MLAFINAKVIDGTGNLPIEKATVIVNGTQIDAVSAGTAAPDGATVVDLQGKTLLPAFSEAHTHFGGSDLLTRPGLGGRDMTYDYALNGAVNLQWGVTTVRSAGDWMPDIVSYRDDVASKRLHAPRILTAGRMFVAAGGHPLNTVYAGNEAIRDSACVVCDETTDIDAEVKALADAGVDWIKAFLSTINKMNYPHPVPRLSHKTLKKITGAAHKYGKPMMLHIENPSELEEALDIGVDSIEHTIGVGNTYFEISDALLHRLSDGKTFVVPTLSGIKAHDGTLQGAEPVYPHLEKAVKKMAAAGVRLGVGCDSGIPFLPYGECVHTEMALLVAAGLSPMDAICAATRGNAELFRLQDKLGTIQAGKLADLVVLDADPLADIRNTRQIKLVMKEGRIMVDRLLAG